MAATQNCYCEALWEKHASSLIAEGIPPGFCSKCEFCGDFGHTRHYPGPVPYTGSWCDICYKVEAHLSPYREIGVWAYDAATDSEFTSSEFESVDVILPYSEFLVTRKSALTINHPARNSIDFRVREVDEILFRYNDYEIGYFVEGLVVYTAVPEVLKIVLHRQNLKKRFQSAGFSFTYIEE